MPAEVQLALGRIFRLMSRPAQPGDMAAYEAARALVLEASGEVAPPYRPNWIRDRGRGAGGD